MEVRLNKGIHLPGCGIYLDPQRVAPLGIVSHAHSDHAGWHGTTIATPETVSLMSVRKSPPAKATIIELPYWQPYETEQAKITLIPAGHILGSAQVLVGSDVGRLL